MEYIAFEHNATAAELVRKTYDTPPLAFVHSYGCQQNVNDGERIKGVLVDIGYGLCDKPEDADLILFNTCAVREHAEQRVFGNVGALKGLKEKKPGLIIGLCAVAVIVILAVFTVRSAKVGRSSFYTIAACAAVAILTIQTILNVFGTMDLLPLTGVTFPFLSNGGSSMLASWGLIAFLKAADTRQNASFAVRTAKAEEVEPLE